MKDERAEERVINNFNLVITGIAVECHFQYSMDDFLLTTLIGLSTAYPSPA